MPNHITNELTAPKHVIDSLKGESEIDFNTVVPMPELMKGTLEGIGSHIEGWASIALGVTTIDSLSSPTPDPVSAFKNGDYGAASKRLHQGSVIRLLQQGPFPKDFNESEFEKFILAMRCLKQFGHATWYTWSTENWGTKWNAYDIVRISDTVVRFDTAWSMPDRVLLALAKKFPVESIRIRWADEDFGNNAGDITIKGETVVSGDKFDNGSQQAEELALELKYSGEIPEHMKRNESGRLVYVEE